MHDEVEELPKEIEVLDQLTLDALGESRIFKESAEAIFVEIPDDRFKTPHLMQIMKA